MTANPAKPARYRPGKALVEEPSSSEEDDEDEQEVQQEPSQKPTAPPPKASSFPSSTASISGNLQKVDLNERKRQAAAAEAARVEAEKAARAAAEEGFVTEESEDEDSDEESGSENDDEDSGSDESSSEDEAPKKLLRPTFIKKSQRKDPSPTTETYTSDQKRIEEETLKTQKTDALIQEQLEKDAAARGASKKDWDDDELAALSDIDDTDNLDPEAERALWKLRELTRVKRDRAAIEAAENELAEITRRRNLTQEDREAEDAIFLAEQKAEREGRASMGHMQKYVHKGAFYQDEEMADRRDLVAGRVQDETNKEVLPEYMQIRDMTKLGRKGRTKYKDLKSEDTGRWGQFERKGGGRRGDDERVDDIFKPDAPGRDGGPSASGSNAAPVGQRRGPAPPEGAPKGPRGVEARGRGGDSYVPGSNPPVQGRRQRSRSYSRSRSRSRSPPPASRRERRHSYSDDDGGRRARKRSPSPYQDRHRQEDKRRRVDPS